MTFIVFKCSFNVDIFTIFVSKLSLFLWVFFFWWLNTVWFGRRARLGFWAVKYGQMACALGNRYRRSTAKMGLTYGPGIQNGTGCLPTTKKKI